jgi:chemotaxis protein MotB
MTRLAPGIEEFPESPPPNRGWMVIFTDLVSLMLTFFVLLFSMSSVQIDRWKEMADALSQSLNPAYEKMETPPAAQYNIATIFGKRAVNLDYLGAVLGDMVTQDPVLAQGRILGLEDRLIVALPGDVMFDPGGATLSERGRQALFVLGGMLRNVGNQIGVNGYTDGTPPGGGAFRSNWELSVARAVAVANSLKRSGYTDDIIAYGYADSRSGQLPDLPADERMSLARRVDIVIFPTVGE